MQITKEKETTVTPAAEGSQSRLQQIKAALQERYRKMQAERTANQQRDRRLNAVLTWLFPVFIVCLAELNQFVQISEFLEFCINRTSVLIFDFLMAYLMYCFLLLLTNRVWVAAWLQGLTYMLLSVVELFKFNTNGNHLKLVDISLAPNIKNLSSFAYIQINLPLVIYVLLLIVVLGVMFWQNPAFTAHGRRRVLPAMGCLAMYAGIVCVPGISETVYGFFDVDTTASENAFSINEKYDNNSLLAFIVETTSEKIGAALQEPEGYDQQMVEAVLKGGKEGSGSVKPNVIVVMSEAFADFRALEGLKLDTDAYDAFDAVAQQGTQLTVAVPTFASYTVRTEFELLFGLPVRSLMDTITPQAKLDVDTPSSFVSYYKDMGYDTAYVHPFTRTFYNRDTIYSTFGFDTMIFDDNMTVPAETFGNGYITDAAVFSQVAQLISQSDAPMFIHTTTMQNHQPYDWKENNSELTLYLEGIRETGKALQQLTAALNACGEPTVLVFVGDHFPSMRGEDNLYDAIGIDSANCSVLYNQSAFIWSNYELNTACLPDEVFSVFYLNSLVLEMTGAPVDDFHAAVLAQLQEDPIYTSVFMEENDRNAVLDLLTYDRVAGEDYSGTRSQSGR
ncbi:MAG: LTA synthase family protein [Oscillospiraceae bacterium]|nr:LTA synthase family protein [Oscillospiraceae bacterium]